MDGSITRRGQPCWYRKDNIGMMAINDALILESCIYELIDKHLDGHPYHRGAIDAFLKVSTESFSAIAGFASTGDLMAFALVILLLGATPGDQACPFLQL